MPGQSSSGSSKTKKKAKSKAKAKAKLAPQEELAWDEKFEKMCVLSA